MASGSWKPDIPCIISNAFPRTSSDSQVPNQEAGLGEGNSTASCRIAGVSSRQCLGKEGIGAAACWPWSNKTFVSFLTTLYFVV